MDAGGLVRNGPNSGALITAYASAVDFSNGRGTGAAGTVINYGTIGHTSGTSGRAVNLDNGGVVINYGLLSGAVGGVPGNYPGVVRTAGQPSQVAGPRVWST